MKGGGGGRGLATPAAVSLFPEEASVKPLYAVINEHIDTFATSVGLSVLQSAVVETTVFARASRYESCNGRPTYGSARDKQN